MYFYRKPYISYAMIIVFLYAQEFFIYWALYATQFFCDLTLRCVNYCLKL
jgi:hypothetical protein